jgi:hypothetical protein
MFWTYPAFIDSFREGENVTQSKLLHDVSSLIGVIDERFVV